MTTNHLTPTELRQKAQQHDRQGIECFRSGMERAARDHADQAANLRQLADEAEAFPTR